MALTIGQLAGSATVNIQTVRYYERRGLLAVPPRTKSGYRQYDLATVRRLRFIRKAQELGFSLEDIKELLALRVSDPSACGAVEHKVHEKILVIKTKVTELTRLQVILRKLEASCRNRKRTAECPVLDLLGDEHVAGT
jgi:MerR family mercuric resistance operon transcriptional regulator